MSTSDLLGMLQDMASPENRRCVAEYINAHESEFRELLTSLFERSTVPAEVKLQLMNIVDLLSEQNTVAFLECAISDTDSVVRVQGLQATYRTRTESLNKRIVSIMRDQHACFEERKWAIHILASTDPERYGKGIREIVRDCSEPAEIRKEAIFSLTCLHDTESLGLLCGVLGDPSVEIRQSGAWALSKIGSPETVNCLFSAMEDPDGVVRDWAIRGLRDMDDTKALHGLAKAIVRAEPEDQVRLIRLVVERRSEVVLRAIAQVLNSHDVRVRREAAWAMAVSPYPPASSSLEALLEDEDEDVRKYAQAALTRIGKGDVNEGGFLF
ncbi:MAG: HEAT repeat domain-containing protein [Candidatus Thorarchaeota archaeon]|nr:HEAT repeat domain-containing protein [Candidatus Thorarchaeota archaeon]